MQRGFYRSTSDFQRLVRLPFAINNAAYRILPHINPARQPDSAWPGQRPAGQGPSLNHVRTAWKSVLTACEVRRSRDTFGLSKETRVTLYLSAVLISVDCGHRENCWLERTFLNCFSGVPLVFFTPMWAGSSSARSTVVVVLGFPT